MIISVHLPKTAGSSFSAALEAAFSGKLVKDYQDYPINTASYDRNLTALKACIQYGESGLNGIECIHGHFLPLKYLLCATRQDLTFVTWMRHPINRLISHYFFWLRSYSPDTAQALHKKVVVENWSLETFCLSDELQNLYTKFLWGFPLELFDFIGITEYYREDLAFFGQQFLGGSLLRHLKVNVAEKHEGLYELDKGLLREIECHHNLDIALYQRALDMRRKRLLGV